MYGYRWLLGLIYPYVGGVRASRLSARMVERAYRELEGRGYSRTTLRTLNLVLAKAFVEQVSRTLGARKPRESDGERPVWSLAEARRFGDHVVGDRLYPMWRLLLVSGLRRGELCGLRCGDLEPLQGTLTVRRQLVVEDPGSRVRVKPPKSHNGVRTLLLDPVTLDLLRPVAAGPASRYLFAGRTGQPIRPDNLTDRFNQLAEHFACRPPAEVVRDYLAEIPRLVAGSADFEALAHIDFVGRFWPAAAGPFDPADFEEEFRQALISVADAGRALEVNTNRTPYPQIVRWWRGAGGEVITFGSDAHAPGSVGHGFPEAVAMAEALGFRPGRHPYDRWYA